MKRLACSILFIALSGCSGQSSETIDYDAALSKTPSPKHSQTVPEDAKGLTEYQLCLVEGRCSISDGHQNIKLTYHDIYQFRGTGSVDDFHMEIVGDFSVDKTPFPKDERNWQAPYDWIRQLEIKINGRDVLLPVSAYADMGPPESVTFKSEAENVNLIFVRNGFATFMRIEPVTCDGKAMGEYAVAEKLHWFTPMAGDHAEHTTYKFPLCN